MSQSDDFYTAADAASDAVLALETWAAPRKMSREKRGEIEAALINHRGQIYRTRVAIDEMVRMRGAALSPSVLSSRIKMMEDIRDDCLRLSK